MDQRSAMAAAMSRLAMSCWTNATRRLSIENVVEGQRENGEAAAALNDTSKPRELANGMSLS